MRAHRWTVAGAAAALAVLASASSATASSVTASPATASSGAAHLAEAAAHAAAPPGALPWSATHGSATASGHRWTEPGQILFRNLVVSGELTNTGPGCASVWTQFTFDLAPSPAFKRAEVCGTGSVDIHLRQSLMPTTTGRLTVCRGTETATDCAPWQSLT
ncbi:hypothetical protein [Streptomyces sparsus]